MAPEADGEIVTVEIPKAVVDAWEKNPQFQEFYQEFIERNPPAKQFRGQKGGKKNETKPTTTTKPMLPKKRRLLPEIGDCLVALDAVADAGEVLCDIPVVNARATKKLSTMPTLCISKKLGAVVKNTSGEEVTW